MPMVEDVLVKWDEMEGENPLVKQLNALLTWAFILRYDVPSNECLSESIVILGLQGIVEAGEWELRVLWFLKERFATASKFDGSDKRTIPHIEKQCERIAPLVFLLVEEYLPGSGQPPIEDLPMFLVSNGFDLTEEQTDGRREPT